eukprot:1147558-Pelagomonas_calceolata.AAC.1
MAFLGWKCQAEELTQPKQCLQVTKLVINATTLRLSCMKRKGGVAGRVVMEGGKRRIRASRSVAGNGFLD